MTPRPFRKGQPLPRAYERKLKAQGQERQMLAAADLAFGSTMKRLEALYGLSESAKRRVKYLSTANLVSEDERRHRREAKACDAHLADLRRAYGPDWRIPGWLTP